MCQLNNRVNCRIRLVLLCLILVACESPHPATLKPSLTPTRTLARLGLIAFGGVRSGEDSEIYTMQADGTRWVNLTNSPGSYSCPAWSPDGKQIAFWSRSGDESSVALYLMSANVSGIHQLVHGMLGADPSWSSDGTHIAFTGSTATREGYEDDVWVVDLNTQQVTNLTKHPAHDITPAWSPHGKKIAFASDRDGPAFKYQIYVMDADGSHVERLTDEPLAAHQPAWSPDGRKIAYTCNHDRGYEICVINADGSHRIELTPSEEFRNGYQPSWSPDGLRIVYRETHGDQSNLYVMNADGSEPLGLTDVSHMGLLSVGCPAWQPILPR